MATNATVSFSFQLPLGNLNIVQVRNALETKLNALSDIVYTVLYDRPTNKISFSHTASQHKVRLLFGTGPNKLQSCAYILGFQVGQDTDFFTSQSPLIAPGSVQLYRCLALYIRTSLASLSALSSRTQAATDILAKIPVSSEPNSVIFFNSNLESFRHYLGSKQISQIAVRLTSDDDTLIQLNGAHWTLSIQFDIVSAG
jgi:hypothetical protein